MKNPKHIQCWALFFPEIKEYLKQQKYQELKKFLNSIHPVDLAEGWRNFSSREKIIIFKLFDTRMAIEVFEELDIDDQKFILTAVDDTAMTDILSGMASDDQAKLFGNLSDKAKKKMVSLLRKEDADSVRKITEYPENTAGNMMSTDFVTLSPEMTARQALEKVQNSARLHRVETVSVVYVVNAQNVLLGGITLRRLIAAPQDIKISEIMSPVQIIKIPADTVHSEISNKFTKYNLTAAPVVDEKNRLVGVITIDDVVDVIHRLATKEVYEIGKMSPEGGEIISYEKATVFGLVKRRIGWLILLLLFDFLTGTILKTFEHALSTVVALSFFIPMLLDTGGNAGAQTSITIIRGLATGDVTLKNAFKIVRIEILAALVMSLAVGIVACIRAMLLQGDVTLAIVVGSSMSLIIVLAILTGVTLPLLSKKIGLDPAALAGPITTSVVDVAGLVLYFKIASFFIPSLRVLK
ncbi:MAG: Magnesium transporter MgtE [Elusimicrobia bacterium ADurb.Bin231]|nr:MAG: Magnesium transporter MgtE [Elusimicrobia bacterium ADurb.Bin231]